MIWELGVFVFLFFVGLGLGEYLEARADLMNAQANEIRNRQKVKK